MPSDGYTDPPPHHRPAHDPVVEARLSEVEADVRDIKYLLTRLEPMLTEMDSSIRRLQAETLPTLEAELAAIRDQVWRPTAVLQVAGTIGGVIALVIALAGFGLLVARFLIR